MKPFSFNQVPAISLESLIDFSPDRMMLREFVLAFEEFKANNKFNGKHLSEIIQRKFKLNITFRLEDSPYPNAWILPPDLDKNNVLINQWRKYFASSAQGRMITNWSEADRFGSIDLKTGVASGFFCKISADATLTTKAFQMLEADECAEILTHEIGHYILMLACLGNSLTGALLLQDIVARAMGNPEKEARFKLMSEIESKSDIVFSNKELIGESQNAETIGVAVYDDIITAQTSMYGSTLYDMRTWEILADNFVVRMGGGAALARALSKIQPMIEPKYFRNNITFYIFEVLKVLFVLAGFALSVMSFNPVLFFVLSMTLAQSPFEREYDKPLERLRHLKMDMITQMKDRRTPQNRLKELEADITVVEAAMKGINENETFFEKFWLLVSPWTRKQKRTTKEIQDIESLVNNELYVTSFRLNQKA